ncbi:MAG: LytR/AlgR family response regulator transcription factor [Faecalibacterium sp.]
MRLAICEDNKLQRELLKHFLSCYFSEKEGSFEIAMYDCGTNFLYDIEDGKSFQVVFLDIYMGDSMGNEIAHKLRGMGYQGEIVFLTSSPDFAIESYEVEARGYLLKPLDYNKLKRVMDRITQSVPSKAYQILQRTTVTMLAYSEILYIESINSKCFLHTKSGETYTIYKTLNTIETELGDQRFLRCHQSFLVNMDHIRQMGKHCVLSNGELVPIRQRGVKSVREMYLNYRCNMAPCFDS